MMKSLKEIEEEKIEQEEFDRIIEENYRRQKALEELTRIQEELGLYIDDDTPNPLIKK